MNVPGQKEFIERHTKSFKTLREAFEHGATDTNIPVVFFYSSFICMGVAKFFFFFFLCITRGLVMCVRPGFTFLFTFYL